MLTISGIYPPRSIRGLRLAACGLRRCPVRVSFLLLPLVQQVSRLLEVLRPGSY